MFEVAELHEAYERHHFVNFGQTRESLPTLDIKVVNFSQYCEVHLGELSVSHAALVLELLRKIAVQRRITIMMVVPCIKQTEDYHAQGWVKHKLSGGWCTAC